MALIGEKLLEGLITYATTGAGAGLAAGVAGAALSSKKRREFGELKKIKSEKTNKKRKKDAEKDPVGPPVKITTRNKDGIFGVNSDKMVGLQEENTLPPGQLVIGKRAYADPVGPFLRQMLGSGSLCIQYAKSCSFQPNTRFTHLELFRHSLGNSANPDGIPQDQPTTGTWRRNMPDNYVINTPDWNNLNLPRYLAFAGSGSSADPAINTVSEVCSHYMADGVSGANSYVGINRAQLENQSWNLNYLKVALKDQQLSAFDPTGNYVDDHNGRTYTVGFAPLMSSTQEKYATNSRIYANNFTEAETTSDGQYVPFTTHAVIPYRACIKYGKITYKFMNKGEGPAKVELIVYKFKKNHDVHVQNTDAHQAQTNEYTSLTDPIKQAWVDTKTQYYPTNLVSTDGYRPNLHDVTENPRYPLLPKLKKIKESDMPYSEIARYECLVPSGSRKVYQIVLPGEVYNPNNINGANVINRTVDSHTYGVMLSFCGTIVSADIHGDVNVQQNGTYVGIENIRGDMYTGGLVQYDAEYQEFVSACVPEAPKTREFFTLGETQPGLADNETHFSEKPVTIVPSDRVLRPGNAIDFTTNMQFNDVRQPITMRNAGATGHSVASGQSQPNQSVNQ